METVERSVVLPTGVEQAWDLITDPDELAGWLGRQVDLDPTPGRTGRVIDHDGTERALVITEVTGGRRLAWTWWTEDGDVPEPSDVTVTLTPVESGTEVHVVERIGDVPAARAEASSEAWSHRLLNLESLLLIAAAVRG